MDFIFIEGLQADARVGVYPREQLTKQAIEINLTFGLPDAAGARDNIDDTISYDQVVKRVREVLDEQHFNLLETLGEFLAKLMFDEFKAPWVELSLVKLGVMQGVRRVGIRIRRERGDYLRRSFIA